MIARIVDCLRGAWIFMIECLEASTAKYVNLPIGKGARDRTEIPISILPLSLATT